MATRGQGSTWVLFVVVAVSTFLLINFREVGGDAVRWNYNMTDVLGGPEHWYKEYRDCAGVMQSPIDIITAEVLYDPNLDPIDFSDYKTTDGVKMTLENVGGHTAEVLFSGTEIFLKGGAFPDSYKLEQFHFHWGQNSRRGSEHAFNGYHYPMEVHFVHRQNHQPNVSVASSHPFGLAVIAFFFKPGNENLKYNQLLDYFSNITNANSGVEIPTFPVYDLLPTSTRYDYFRYFGSLTTPPCYESVIWTIGTDVIELSERQMEKFRALYDAELHHLVDDYRPIQSINQRTVLTTHLMYRTSTNHASLAFPHLASFLLTLLTGLYLF